MKTDNQIREGFHSIEILLKNRPEVIKKVIVPEAREDARILKLLQACFDNDVAGPLVSAASFSSEVSQRPSSCAV